jgi:hypothetical protein
MARAEEESIECDECYVDAPVRQMSLSRGSLVCASCVTSRAARVLSTFHIRDPPKKATTDGPKKTTETKKKNKENKENKGNKTKQSGAPRSASF